MEYLVSKAEILRRKKAYKTLSISLLTGAILSSVVFSFYIPILGYFSVAVALFLIGAFSYNFFSNLLRIKIILSDKKLQRITNKTTENYLLSDIYRIEIKRTKKNTIREIYIWLNNGRSIFITALEKFEQFEKELSKQLDKSIFTKEINESLDFNHPLFYPILGLLIGSIGILAIKFIGQLSSGHLLIVLFIFFIYLLFLGIYLVKNKPISRRIGKQKF